MPGSLPLSGFAATNAARKVKNRSGTAEYPPSVLQVLQVEGVFFM